VRDQGLDKGFAGTTDIRINKEMISAKKGEAPIDGCIFEGGGETS
jgi:hypothetical protein